MLHLVEKNLWFLFVFIWKKSMLSAGKKGWGGRKRWKKLSLSNQQFLVRSEAAFMEKRRQTPKNHPQRQFYQKLLLLLLCFILQLPFGEGTCFTSPPAHSLNNWVLSAHSSVASIFCCLMIFFSPQQGFSFSRNLFERVSQQYFALSDFEEWKLLHLCKTDLLPKSSWQIKDRKQTDRWIKYKGQGKCACWCTLSWSKKSL